MLDRIQLDAFIAQWIKTNGQKQITGQILQDVLLALSSSSLVTLSDKHLFLSQHNPTKSYSAGATFIKDGKIWIVNDGEEQVGAFDEAKNTDLIGQVLLAGSFSDFDPYDNAETYEMGALEKVSYQFRLFKYIGTNPIQGEAPLDIDGVLNDTYWVELSPNGGKNGEPWNAGVYKEHDIVRVEDVLYRVVSSGTFVSSDFDTELLNGEWRAISEKATLKRIELSTITDIDLNLTDVITFDKQDYIDTPDYAHSITTNPERVTVSEDGYYDLAVNLRVRRAVNNRGVIAVIVKKNGLPISTKRAESYIRGVNYGTGSINFQTSISLVAGDYIELQGIIVDEDSNASHFVMANESEFIVKRVADTPLTNTWRPEITDAEVLAKWVNNADVNVLTDALLQSLNANTTDRHTHTNKAILDIITGTGNANEFLAADGTYKVVNVGTGSGDPNFRKFTGTIDLSANDSGKTLVFGDGSTVGTLNIPTTGLGDATDNFYLLQPVGNGNQITFTPAATTINDNNGNVLPSPISLSKGEFYAFHRSSDTGVEFKLTRLTQPSQNAQTSYVPVTNVAELVTALAVSGDLHILTTQPITGTISATVVGNKYIHGSPIITSSMSLSGSGVARFFNEITSPIIQLGAGVQVKLRNLLGANTIVQSSGSLEYEYTTSAFSVTGNAPVKVLWDNTNKTTASIQYQTIGFTVHSDAPVSIVSEPFLGNRNVKPNSAIFAPPLTGGSWFVIVDGGAEQAAADEGAIQAILDGLTVANVVVLKARGIYGGANQGRATASIEIEK